MAATVAPLRQPPVARCLGRPIPSKWLSSGVLIFPAGALRASFVLLYVQIRGPPSGASGSAQGLPANQARAFALAHTFRTPCPRSRRPARPPLSTIVQWQPTTYGNLLGLPLFDHAGRSPVMCRHVGILAVLRDQGRLPKLIFDRTPGPSLETYPAPPFQQPCVTFGASPVSFSSSCCIVFSFPI